MKKTLSWVSMICLGAIAVFATPATAREINCINYLISNNQQAQCFKDDLTPFAVPGGYIPAPSPVQNRPVRRRATAISDIDIMIMPDLVGSKVNVAEDYLLSRGITLGSEPVHEPNRVTGEITQQFPAPGTRLQKGETVLLQYMGASVNSIQLGNHQL